MYILPLAWRRPSRPNACRFRCGAACAYRCPWRHGVVMVGHAVVSSTHSEIIGPLAQSRAGYVARDCRWNAHGRGYCARLAYEYSGTSCCATPTCLASKARGRLEPNRT